jgi:glucosamine--fructose-6-phosphate aminotransferase (isomerizing)
MCGIVGYTGTRPALPLLLAGLGRLEYRGYDSAGVALASADKLAVTKRAGRLAVLETATAGVEATATTGIAHTRWATHGDPTDANAHPHTDESGAVAVVHNGIIENHAALRAELEGAGHHFASATDSEVIAHLVEAAYTGDLVAAVRAAVARLRGQWALAVLHRDAPGVLVGARHDAPLVVGIGADEQFLVSDPAVLAGAVEQLSYLDDGDLVELRPGGITRFDAAGTPRPLDAVALPTFEQATTRDGYASFMEKEMDEQPAVIAAVLAGRVSETGIHLAELDPLASSLASVTSIEFVACGSAYHAALGAATLAETLLDLPARVHVASEFRYAPPRLGAGSLVVAISQSGETADTLAAARLAQRSEAILLTLVNVTGSTLARESSVVIGLRAGSERSVAATKSYTAQALTALLVVLDLVSRRGQLPRDVAAAWTRDLAALPDAATVALRAARAIDRIAPTYATAHGLTFVGRGAGLASAREGALKTKELSYLPAEAYPAGELKHGPIALLGADHPVVAVLLDDPVRGKLEGNLAEARARGARLLAIGTGVQPAIVDDWVAIPAARPELAALLAVLPLQRLACTLARLRGHEIDFPRNLAKSVTVE